MDGWGPFALGPHCGSLTFTLLFQEVVMGIMPASCALLLALVRIKSLFRRPSATERSVGYGVKLVGLVHLDFCSARISDSHHVLGFRLQWLL